MGGMRHGTFSCGDGMQGPSGAAWLCSWASGRTRDTLCTSLSLAGRARRAGAGSGQRARCAASADAPSSSDELPTSAFLFLARAARLEWSSRLVSSNAARERLPSSRRRGWSGRARGRHHHRAVSGGGGGAGGPITQCSRRRRRRMERRRHALHSFRRAPVPSSFSDHAVPVRDGQKPRVRNRVARERARPPCRITRAVSRPPRGRSPLSHDDDDDADDDGDPLRSCAF